MDPTLRLHPGQHVLTPAQAAETRRFVREWITVQLSTEPVNEPEAEALLRQVYELAFLPPPKHIHWVDGPLQLVALLAPDQVEASVQESVNASVRESVDASVRESIYTASVRDSARYSRYADSAGYVEHGIRDSLWAIVKPGSSVTNLPVLGKHSVRRSLYDSVLESVRDLQRDSPVWTSLGNSLEACVQDSYFIERIVWNGVRAYNRASVLACYHFLDTYLAPNAAHALAPFNALVSGYWTGRELALLVRRPRVLALDQEGRVHSATGRCVEYRDGWGFYAWHGVRVPERVILAPETLTREDFLSEQDVEVRRVIQERMGERFVSELGGVVIDAGPRGTLYEVALPEDDPEQVARYVRVQDASTFRQYFLRVPPTVQTAAEAVAWTFQVAAEDYHPAQET